MNYIFEGEHFGISEESFHLLRSRFNYKTYSFQEINQLEVSKGKLVNNWIAILVIGLGLLAFSLYYAFAVLDFLQYGRGRIYVEEIVIPVLPFLMGLYCLYAALRSGPILQASFADGKKKSFPLDRVKKAGNLEELLELLKEKDGLKSKVQFAL